MASNIDKILSEALAKNGLVLESQLNLFIGEAQKTSETLAAVLIRDNVLTEEAILHILAKELKLPFVNLKDITIDKATIGKVPFKIASYYKFLPIKFENSTLTIAVPYPLDIKTQDEIRTHLGYHIEMALSTKGDVIELLKMHYGLAAETIQEIMLKTPQKQSGDSILEKVEDIEKLATEASVIKLVNQIILEAHNRRASDVHIEPYRGKVKLRYRIDGILYNAPVPLEIVNFYSAILSRIKIMANLNIVERRLPQDGRAVVKIGEQNLDLRISSLPTPYGEGLVIRLLPTKMLFSLARLGLRPPDLKIFESFVKKVHGIIFITGPTGSGKTTTLYACLSSINTDARKIITIEDPIEYELEGVTQIQIAPEIGLDFARGLRSMLRHDPDVMMVGEVRDRETADIAIRVALTGHLVFSTIHTNDAPSGVTRLLDIGIEPYLIASSTEAFVAQRLVRVICPHCQAEDQNQPYQLKIQIAKELNLGSPEEVRIYKGKGCKICNFTGFYGRTAIYEILMVDDVIKDLILRKLSAGEIKKVAIQRGMHTLRQDGFRKVLSGITTPDEVIRATQEEYQDLDKLSKGESREQNKNDKSVASEGKTADEDKRIYPRLETQVNVSHKMIKPAAKKGEQPERLSVAKNISAGGLLFSYEEALPVGAILKLKIELPDTENPIQCLARVSRVEEIEEDKVFNVAICFLDISSADRARVERYISEELR